MAKEKTFVEDVQRDLYDFRDEEIDFYRVDTGLTEDIVLQISEENIIISCDAFCCNVPETGSADRAAWQ